MLNRACRFFPIVRVLRAKLPLDAHLLEIGSGALGLGEYWASTFTGCDVSFPSRPVSHMRAIRCSGHQLPFPDRSFDGVVVSDVMEHVPPEQRRQVLKEALRVARQIVVIGYPCGPAAFEVDEDLYSTYRKREIEPPSWLQEHMLYPYPDEELLEDLPDGWRKMVIPNETLRFHAWMTRMEMSRELNYFFRLSLRVMPGFLERILRRVNKEPAYRKIFVLTQERRQNYA